MPLVGAFITFLMGFGFVVWAWDIRQFITFWFLFTPSGRLPRSFNWYQSRLGSFNSFLQQALWPEGDMEKGVVKLVVSRNYLLSWGHAIWEIVQEAYVILATLDNATQGEVQRYENNYKALNLITTTLGRNVYGCVSHLETAHDVWLKLGNTYEGSSKIKSSRNDTYNRQYQTFSQKSGESLDDCFARFKSIMSSLCSCGLLAYSDNQHAKQLLYTLDDHVWGMKITALKELLILILLP
jgi:hypothetical protein